MNPFNGFLSVLGKGKQDLPLQRVASKKQCML